MDIKWDDIDTNLVLKEGKNLLALLAAGLAGVLKKKSTIAVTGMQGAGKTVLLDYLSGKASKPNYTLPLQSQQTEHGSVRTGEKRLRLSVVPGQADALPRLESLDELFKSNEPVDGIVHVVANGYATIRSPDAAQVLIKELKIDTIPKLREHQLQREIADLESTCAAIRESHRKHHRPSWLLVAVDKIDLYYSSLAKVRSYYAPNSDSEFARCLRELAGQVGSDFFRWDVAPVCTSLLPFDWHKQHQAPLLQEDKRNAYVAQLLRVLESYCG